MSGFILIPGYEEGFHIIVSHYFIFTRKYYMKLFLNPFKVLLWSSASELLLCDFHHFSPFSSGFLSWLNNSAFCIFICIIEVPIKLFFNVDVLIYRHSPKIRRLFWFAHWHNFVNPSVWLQLVPGLCMMKDCEVKLILNELTLLLKILAANNF